jgi:dihydroorotate dehydrogenase subfamily 1
MSADLSIKVNGMQFENPFLLGSGPPGTNARVIAKSYDLGWAGVVCKTISLDASQVVNTVPRYAKVQGRASKEVVGFENIELISDRPFTVWLEELAQLKREYPKKILVASIMEEMKRERWHAIVRAVQDTGVDAFELNLSCPHGLPERKMGMAMGENPDLVSEVVGWVKEVSRIPVWAKMTPNVGDITQPVRAALAAGADGIAAINTILSIAGVDLKTLQPLPTVEGHTIPGGYSGQAVRPIALRHCSEIARAFPGVELSGMGGIETGANAVEFMLLGSTTVQVCTGAMLRGYEMIEELADELSRFMVDHRFTSLREFIGKSLPYLTTHADLVARQRAAKVARAAQTNLDGKQWQGNIATETDSLVGNA